MISLARERHPLIGSLRFDDDTTVALRNRPLFRAHSLLEAEGIRRAVIEMYPDSSSFVDHMLQTCEQAFRARPSAVHDKRDCRQQMSHLALLRSNIPNFIDMDYRGPFVLQFTDWNPGNFFVDDAWNLVCIIDLEFVNVLPPDMMCEPYWATVGAIDDISSNMYFYRETHNIFMEVLRNEELKSGTSNDLQLAGYVQKGLETGSRWIYGALTVDQGIWLYVENFIYQKLELCFTDLEEQDKYEGENSRNFTSDSDDFVRRKVADKKRHDRELEAYFAARW